MRKRKWGRGEIAIFAVLVVSLIASICAGFVFAGRVMDYKASDEEYEYLESEYVSHSRPDEEDKGSISDEYGESPEKVPAQEEPLPIVMPDVDWSGLKAENADIIGWIEVPAVDIAYPVLQGNDNQEYLHKTVSGEWRTAGSIFLDSENNPDMTDLHSIIYGHNMRNGSMFAALKQFNDADVLQTCPYFWVCTEEKGLLYQIVSVHRAVTGDESFTLFPFTTKNRTFDSFLKNEMNKSDIDCVIPEGYLKRMVTLSTCTPSSDSTRQLVQGTLIREVRGTSCG